MLLHFIYTTGKKHHDHHLLLFTNNPIKFVTHSQPSSTVKNDGTKILLKTQDRQALLKAKYCPRANRFKQYHAHKKHTKTYVTLNFYLWPRNSIKI